LYHDSRRIASFLSRINDFGLLQQIKRIEAVEETATDQARAGTEFSIPALARAYSGIDKVTAETAKNSAEKTYDPLWTNALEFLSYLEQRGAIRRDFSESTLRQFIYFKGKLIAYDLEMLRNVWSKNSVRKVILQTVKSQSKDKSKNKDFIANPDAAFDLLGLLPHSVQAMLLDDNKSAWCTLDPESIVGQSSDLILKHGTLIQGRVVNAWDFRRSPRRSGRPDNR
jgi:hypothetical protein